MAGLDRVKNLALNVRILTETLRADTQAQDLVEYALMAGFVAVMAGAIMPGVATNISKIFSSVASVLFNSKSTGS